jgi:hypothetical protein
MRIYFDTNVYSTLYKTGGVQIVRRGLASKGFQVVASDVNLIEMYAIPDEAERKAEISALTRIAGEYLRAPKSWGQAREVRNEIGRTHPEWVRRFGPTRDVRWFLKQHREYWTEARRGDLPPAAAFARYRRDAEQGTLQSRSFQKEVRSARLEDAKQLVVTSVGSSYVGAAADDPEIFWRVLALGVWHSALMKRAPASRDYHDWIAPFVKLSAIDERALARFWLVEVEPDSVPLNRIASLVSFYQTDSQITHGNGQDQNHACMAVDVDRFVTADRAFWKALTLAITRHMVELPHPILVDRQATPFAEHVLAALE